MIRKNILLALCGLVLLIIISLGGWYLRYYSNQHYVLYYLPQIERYVKLTPYWNNYYLGFSEHTDKLMSYRMRCPKDCDYIRISRKENVFYSYWIYMDLEHPGNIHCRGLKQEDYNRVTLTFYTSDIPNEEFFPDSLLVIPFKNLPKRYAAFCLWADSTERIDIQNLANCSIVEIERVNM